MDLVNYWIFVSTPYTNYNYGDVEGTIVNSRNWLIGKRTHHRKSLSTGDMVLFYKGGDSGRKIIGSAELVSSLKITKDPLTDDVAISNVRVFDPPINIKPLILQLSFIKNPKRWGIYFRSGVVKITRKDYEIILAN